MKVVAGRCRRSKVLDFELKADLVTLAMGFVHPVHEGMLADLGVALDGRGSVQGVTEGAEAYQTVYRGRVQAPVTCAVVSRWWSGRFAKAGSARARWTST